MVVARRTSSSCGVIRKRYGTYVVDRRNSRRRFGKAVVTM
jgi:hypothetical protein